MADSSVDNRYRGRNYPPFRGLIERLIGCVCVGDWPAAMSRMWPPTLAVTPVRQTLAVLPESLDQNLRVAFLSDIHIGPTTSHLVLKAAVDLVRQSKPDVVILGGDYFFLEADAKKLRRFATFLSQIEARHKFAVMGNHDLWTDYRAIESTLRQQDFCVLNNEVRSLPEPFHEVSILGVDDPWAGLADVPAVLEAAGDAKVKLAVCHSPEILPKFFGSDIDLLMCGHTHGGQIALPPSKPIAYQAPWGKKYIAGRHDADGVPLFVSRGLGTVLLPIRFLAPPEVGIFDLVKTTASTPSGAPEVVRTQEPLVAAADES